MENAKTIEILDEVSQEKGENSLNRYYLAFSILTNV